MTRRSFYTALNRVARAADRSHRAHVRAQTAHAKSQARAHVAQLRAVERELKSMEKAERERYLAVRAAEVASDNAQIVLADLHLQGLLHTSLRGQSSVDYTDLYRQFDESALDANPELRIGPAPSEQAFLPLPQGFLAKALGIGKEDHAKKEVSGRDDFARAKAAYDAKITRRAEAVAEHRAEVAAHNLEVDAFQQAVISGAPDAIVRYAELVLDSSEYPEGFPQDFKVAYVADSKQIVVDYELPRLDDVVAEVDEYKYARTSDKISAKKRPDKARNALYDSVIAQATLRTLHELLSAKGLAAVEVVVFNGFVNTVDPATGKKIAPYLISVRTTRDKFQGLELSSVEPITCLRSLNAAVSRSARDLAPVKPIVEFNMVDPRFVTEQDILSSLDSRPNLMELTPGEFESLITNLFQKMGLETKLTQASRDGGVDCVAYDARPILGGKVVVQAKRYRHTVGVSAVRDLFGTMHNEGASKGILVTTSGFGSAAFNFANGKPIELLTGANLLYLLKEHADIDAKIEVPPEWVDLHLDVYEADPVEVQP